MHHTRLAGVPSKKPNCGHYFLMLRMKDRDEELLINKKINRNSFYALKDALRLNFFQKAIPDETF